MTNILPTLSDRAMLASLSIRSWSARKLDRKITDETNLRHNASADAGRYNKTLLSKDALAEIVKCSGEARQTHYSMTLPWLDDGSRILTVAVYDAFSEKMRVIREDWENAVRIFVRGYPDYVEQAKVRLNGMFNAVDYPDPDHIAAKFGFSVKILPVPDANDFRATVGDDQAAMIKSEIEQATQEAIQNAMRDVWTRIADTVGHMASKLKAYEPVTVDGKVVGIFRDSLVENVRDLVNILPALNLTNDVKLVQVCERMQRDLCEHDASDLRMNDNARGVVARAAQAIVDQVSDFMS